MKFVNLNTLTIDNKTNGVLISLNFGDANFLLDMSISTFEEMIKSKLGNEISKFTDEFPIIFNIEISDCDTEEDFEYLSNFIVDNIFKNIIMNEGREREYRLGIPEIFEDLNCHAVPLQKAINNKTAIDLFTIVIEDSKKGLVYKIVE